MPRKTDTRSTVKVVTANSFITAHGMDKMSLNARKLLYLAISQCRKTDTDFYEYSISIRDFADLTGIQENNLYSHAKGITKDLMSTTIECALGSRDYDQYSLFSKCSYRAGEGTITFKLNPDMTNFLLNVKKDFTQPLLADFVKMNSPYSMAVWHLMQREMHSKKPSITQKIEFDLTVEELRQVTGTENKLRQIGQFKERVLDKAIREIKDNCGVVVTYTNLKKSRTVVGFHFVAVQEYYIDESDIPERIKKSVEAGKRRIAAEQQRRGISPTLTPEPEELPMPQPHSRPLTQMEKEQYNRQTKDAEQLNLFSFLENQ